MKKSDYCKNLIPKLSGLNKMKKRVTYSAAAGPT